MPKRLLRVGRDDDSRAEPALPAVRQRRQQDESSAWRAGANRGVTRREVNQERKGGRNRRSRDDGVLVQQKKKKVKRRGREDVALAPQSKVKKRWAYVICPGSVTDRCWRSQLNGNERRLLLSGPLSWNWLRKSPPEPASEGLDADPMAHAAELKLLHGSMPEASAHKLSYLDLCLGRDGLWPPCPARIALAKRLHARGGMRRRCQRHFVEVVLPLLTEDTHNSLQDAAPGAGAAGEGGSAAHLQSVARSMCKRCARDWLSTSGKNTEGGVTALRGAWMELLRHAVDPDKARVSSHWRPFLLGLRCTIFARLCPNLDEAAQRRMLDAVTAATASSLEVQERGRALVVLPLGFFTLAQVLLLVALVRFSGSEAMVVRRSATGSPVVIFRTIEETLGGRRS